MPDLSPILSLPLILPAQAQKHVTHNEALRLLDVMVQLAVLNRNLSGAPALPAIGDRHIVAAGAVGAWAGQVGKIALYTVTGWQFFAPLAGWQAHVLAEGVTVVFSGLVWAAPPAQSTAPLFGVNATADATNRLTVQSAATLLNHNGAGHQVKVNKAGVGDTASLLFQTGFSGRAEMGLAGNDAFSIKVSPDGTTFNDALSADPATGSVTLAKPAVLTGQAGDPVSPANGTIWHNSTSGEVKLRAGGVTQVVGAGGGISDGDKGDITVSGGGTAWAIDAGAVTLGKMASIATDSFLGRDTTGTGAPEVMTPAQARTILNVANGATSNASDAALRDRATHTGTQAAATITGLAAVATSGSAADLGAGILPAARFDDTAHGARGGGSLHAGATTSVAGFLSGADKTKLDGVAVGAQVNVATDLDFTPASRVLASSTGADVTLPIVSAADAGLAPASGGGTANFLRADGTWAAPSGGGGGVSDGDKGDITVAASGAAWTIDTSIKIGLPIVMSAGAFNL